MDDAVDRLYGLDLGDFIAERDALAKHLRADGDKDGAGEVKALRKPSRAAWVVNGLARSEPKLITALGKAADKLAAAQEEALSGGGGKAMRKPLEEVRGATDALMAAVDPGESDGTREAVRLTLQAAVIDPEARDEVAAGRLTQELEGAGFGGVGSAAPAHRAPRPAAKAADDGAGTPKPGDTKAAADDDDAAKPRAAKTRGEAKAGAKAKPATPKAKATAKAKAKPPDAAAEKREAKRQQDLRAAETAVTEAGDELEAARSTADDHEAEAAAARGAHDQAKEELEAARQAVEDATAAEQDTRHAARAAEAEARAATKKAAAAQKRLDTARGERDALAS